MPRLTKIERELRDAKADFEAAILGRDHWRNKAEALEKQLAARTERTEHDFEILRKDVNGYKAEVERKDRIILELQAQIGRLCISKGIIR